MTVRVAACGCGALVARCTGDPLRSSVCHCHNCQRRSGSVFAAQARFAAVDVRITGESHSWRKTGDSGNWAEFHFCPTCGSTLWYRNQGMPDEIAIPTGAFADDSFPAPDYSVYEGRMKPWVAIIGNGIDHID